MALFMFMAKYTPEAIKAIAESDSDREEMVRQTVEAAGGTLHGFYGLLGQEYHVALIAEMPGIGEYLGTVLAATMGGAIAEFKTIPMYKSEDMNTARATYGALKSVYAPPS